MKKYKIKISLERVVGAKDEYEADEKFWSELEDDNTMENTTTENRLADSIEIEEVCSKCGISLNLDEEKEDGVCVSCDNCDNTLTKAEYNKNKGLCKNIN